MPRKAGSAEAARGKVSRPWRPRGPRVASGAPVPRCPPPHSSPPCSRCWCRAHACSCCSRLWRPRGCLCAPRPCATGKVSRGGAGMARFLSPQTPGSQLSSLTASQPHHPCPPSFSPLGAPACLVQSRIISANSFPTQNRPLPCYPRSIHSLVSRVNTLPELYKHVL